MHKERSTKDAFLFIFKCLKPFPIPTLIMIWVAFFWAIDLSIRPYLLKIMLNLIADETIADVFSALFYPVLLYLLAYFVMTTSFRLYDYFVEIKMVPQLRSNIADQAMDALIDKNHIFYQNNFSGSLANKINDLTSSIPEIIRIIIDRFLSHALALVIAIYTLWQVNASFAIFMLIWASLFTLGAMLFSKRLSLLATSWSEWASRITGQLVDILSNILSVRLFSNKRHEKNALEQTFKETIKAEQKLQWAYAFMWLAYGYSFFILQALNFYFLIKGRQEGTISVGDFALVLMINISIIDFLWQLAKEFSQFSKLMGKVVQALQTINPIKDSEKTKATSKLEVTKGQITFEQVKFHYKGATPLFENLSINIEAGQSVGLVGYSGSGKTTFVNLILRLYELNSGRILIDGQDISLSSLDSLREQIGMIPQDPSLFHRSLMDNIRYGRINASNEEVIDAAKRGHAHEFIERLPEAYESLVGERGVKLSGGQRQRIAIARAILKDAPILILDEATSQLDSLTESEIQESLWQLMQTKTTMVIAHRLSTLLHMDRILVFAQGRIVEDGSHEQLLAKGGLYKTLWDAQVGGFLADGQSMG